MRIRRRIFFGCEGASERGYVRWLQGLADQLGKRLAFDPHIVGGGDPLAIVEESVKRLDRQTQKYGRYAAAAILLDSDRVGLSPERDALIARTSRGAAILLYQRFDHEAVLLRHFPKCERLRPPRGKSHTRLLKEWPEYKKPADALTLSKKLDLHHLKRMLKVEAEFMNFFAPLLLR